MKKINIKEFIPLAHNDLYGINKNGVIINFKTMKILKQRLSKKGYYKIVIRNKLGKKRNLSIHRLVALAFIPKPVNKNIVNHKNGNKLDNRATNLEWNTIKENTIHAFDNGLISTSNKIEVYDIIKNEYRTYRSIQQVSKLMNIDLKHFLGFIKYSYKYPFKDRYIFKIEDEDSFLTNLNSKENGKIYYCYDHEIYKIKKYESIGLLTYYTGIRSILKFTPQSLLSMGYIISTSELDKEKCIKECSIYTNTFINNRSISRSKKYIPRNGTYYIKDMLNNKLKILSFKFGLDFKKYVFKKHGIDISKFKIIPRSDQNTNSKLVAGYNVQYVRDGEELLPWKEYTLEKVLLSRNLKFKHQKCYLVFNKINNERKYIIGNFKAIKYIEDFFPIHKISKIPISKIDEQHLNAINDDIIFSRLNKIKI